MYPTETEPQPFTYRAKENVKSRLATHAPVALKSAPYPLILFAHGGYGSGYDSVFFTDTTPAAARLSQHRTTAT